MRGFYAFIINPFIVRFKFQLNTWPSIFDLTKKVAKTDNFSARLIGDRDSLLAVEWLMLFFYLKLAKNCGGSKQKEKWIDLWAIKPAVYVPKIFWSLKNNFFQGFFWISGFVNGLNESPSKLMSTGLVKSDKTERTKSKMTW